VNDKKPPLLNTTLRWFLFAMILANISGGMIFTLLAVYLAQLGASVGQIGLVFSIASIVPLALQLIGGWLSDSIGRLRTIAIGSVCAVFGLLLLWLAPSWQWVLVALCIENISSAMVRPSFGPFVAEQSTEEMRGRVYGLSSGLFLVVDVIGPLLGGFLAYRYGFQPMLFVAFLIYASATVLRVWMAGSARFVGHAKVNRPSLGSLRASMHTMALMLAAGGLLAWVLLIDGVADVAYTLSGDLIPLYLSQIGGLTVAQVGTIASIRGLFTMLVTMPAGWASDRLGERLGIAVGFAIQFVAFMLFVQVKSFAGFTVASALFAVGVGAIIPAFQSLISKAVPENMRGVAFGLYGTSVGVFSLPAPWLGAQLWERISPAAPFTLTAIALLVSIVPVLTKFTLPGKQRAPTAAVSDEMQ
jgi:MFS family permease